MSRHEGIGASIDYLDIAGPRRGSARPDDFPVWFFGWVALAAAFVFQALALHDGPLSIVQPVLVASSSHCTSSTAWPPA
jgi:hypothetical protein